MGEIFSNSRLSSFENCPKKFHFRYVLKIPAPSESIEAFVGKRVHEVFERLYIALDKGHVPTLAQVLRRYNALWDEHYAPERVRIVRSENSVDFYRENGEQCLTNYYRRHYPFDADETLSVEDRVLFALDDTGQYRFQGIIDRVSRARDGAIEIHDYKTGQWVPSQKKLDVDRQLALYQIGIGERHGAGAPVRLVWHYVLRGQTRTSTRTTEQLRELRAETMELIDQIRAEVRFEPRPGPLCRWCEYAYRCPANPEARADAPQMVPPSPDGQLRLL